MTDLNLPIVRDSLPDPEPLNMDEYFEFVLMNLQYVTDIQAYRKDKENEPVNVRFSLK